MTSVNRYLHGFQSIDELDFDKVGGLMPAIVQVTMRCSSSCSYLPKGAENLHPLKNPHVDVIAAVCITVKTWKKPRRPSLGDG